MSTGISLMPVVFFLCQLDVLVCLSVPVTRKKIREVLPALLVLGDAAEDVFQPGLFIHSARLAGGQQGIDNRGSLGGGLVIAAEHRFPPQLSTISISPPREALLYPNWFYGAVVVLL